MNHSHTGHSVCAFVHGFEPYFLVQAPDRRFSPDDCEALRSALNVRRQLLCALPGWCVHHVIPLQH